MLIYYLRLAAKSIASTPGLTALAILGIGIGIAVPTTVISIHHVFSQDPIPHKSDVLYNVRMDSWDPDTEFFDIKEGDPPKQITYRDMEGLRNADPDTPNTGIGNARGFVYPEAPGQRPYNGFVRLCHNDFFAMFDVPMRYGSAWDDEADRQRRRVVVLSHDTNERLFGGADSVGETVRIAGGEFTVVGVLDPYRPVPQFYDIIANSFGEARDFFMPFDIIREQDLTLNRFGNTDNWGPFPSDPDARYTASEQTWIQFWVELPETEVAAYSGLVDAYTLQQKEAGRFQRPLNNRVTPLMEWMEVREVTPPASFALVIIGGLFLMVCCLNLVGLLLGKFLARAGILGVHRALGATRKSIFVQRLVECEVIGALGGLAGILLSALALRIIDQIMPDQFLAANLFQIDGFSLFVGISLALAAGLLSGIYPAWRACHVAPALQLKIQ